MKRKVTVFFCIHYVSIGMREDVRRPERWWPPRLSEARCTRIPLTLFIGVRTKLRRKYNTLARRYIDAGAYVGDWTPVHNFSKLGRNRLDVTPATLIELVRRLVRWQAWEESYIQQAFTISQEQTQLTFSDRQAKGPTRNTHGQALAMLLFVPSDPK